MAYLVAVPPPTRGRLLNIVTDRSPLGEVQGEGGYPLSPDQVGGRLSASPPARGERLFAHLYGKTFL